MNMPDVKNSGELVKDIGELIRSTGPTDEQRQAFGRTFLGTLLGQTVVLTGTLLLYLSSLAVIWQYWSDGLKKLHADLGNLSWFVLGAPFICILLFSMLPAAWMARRQHQLKVAAIGGDIQFDATHFRPYPYQETDRSAFVRLDGADRTILHWLTITRESLVYLSGASGVGKSSLMAASVVPQLRDAGWKVIETRLYGDPMERVRSAVLNSEVRPFNKKMNSETSLRDLLVAAVNSRRGKSVAPLLIVVDQFEEYLILQKTDQRTPFADFLGDLVKNPIFGLRILLVFRSDYQSLIFKVDLPSLVAGENWQELAPYDRDEATAFLRNSGRELSAEAFDRLFRGLDRIEEAPGMYRLITLNMVGLVLERMGRTLEGDASRLIQLYLTTCLTSSGSRDFSKPVLAQLISDAGTKVPRSEVDLVKNTGLVHWQVRSTLTDLARHGLVRQLEETTQVWEIAHDFLARIIGQLIGRLQPSLWHRIRPLVAPAVLLGWIGLAVVAVPSWMIYQQGEANAALQRLGVSFRPAEFGGISVDLHVKDDADLVELARHLKWLDVTQLILGGSNITDLTPLGALKNLKSLLVRMTRVSNLAPLSGLTDLALLDVSQTNVKDIEPLRGLNLKKLWLAHTQITSLEPLRGMASLDWLVLDDTDINDLQPLASLTNLTLLRLGKVYVQTLEPLRSLTKLESLSLGATTIPDLMMLSSLVRLKHLDLSNTKIEDLRPLMGLVNLTELDISHNPVEDVEPLKVLTNLKKLSIEGTRVRKLSSLREIGALSISGTPSP